MSSVGEIVFMVFVGLLFAGAIALALVTVFWLPGKLFDFRRPVQASIFVPCFTIALWLAVSGLKPVVPGILFTSPHKTLAGFAMISALVWIWIEEYWWD